MPHSEDGFKELSLMMDAMFRFGAESIATIGSCSHPLSPTT